ncbi:hypothetical protein BT67DRAFT_172235, partial [Trichocladium antarcticum]
ARARLLGLLSTPVSRAFLTPELMPRHPVLQAFHHVDRLRLHGMALSADSQLRPAKYSLVL